MDEYISIGYLLNSAAGLAKQDLAKRLSALGLTFPQWTVLRDLSNHQGDDWDELNMAAIARRLNTNRPNIMGMLERLENLDLVRRSINPDNRRAHIVRLTDKAAEVMAELKELSRQTSGKALQGFSSQEQSAVTEYLARIVSNFQSEDELEGRDSECSKQNSLAKRK